MTHASIYRMSAWFAWVLPFLLASLCATGKDVRDLSQHFNQPGGDTAPWIFIPNDNIREFSTSEHPGLATIWQDGKGHDIKGILEAPIRIDDYPLPWEFQLGLLPNFAAITGFGSKQQQNFAIGLNLAVTFSDPSTWPENRMQRPPDTREVQLLIVHLGSSGEFEPGLPQFSDYPHPETYMLYGRGDLAHNVMGDWGINHIWEGGTRYHGTAAHQYFFRCEISSPGVVQIGFKSEAKHGWTSRSIDCSKFGRITGIWEIGPIFSCDRWIPDVLCRHLPMQKGYHFFFGGSTVPDGYVPKMLDFDAPEPVAPHPNHEFYIDYCVFFGGTPAPLTHLSDEFNIAGYLGQWQAQIPFGFNTWSNPGYLTVTTNGPSQGMFFSSVMGTNLDLRHHRPPFELEICFIPPGDEETWNFYLNCMVTDRDGVARGGWRPGVANLPAEGVIRYTETPFTESSFSRFHSDWYLLKDAGVSRYDSLFDLEFNPELPEEVLRARPLYMLMQIIDPEHVRMGFRSGPDEDWHLSKVFDCSRILKGGIGQFQQFCFSSVTGRHWGSPSGSPMYQTFKFDYIRYREGLGTN